MSTKKKPATEADAGEARERPAVEMFAAVDVDGKVRSLLPAGARFAPGVILVPVTKDDLGEECHDICQNFHCHCVTGEAASECEFHRSVTPQRLAALANWIANRRWDGGRFVKNVSSRD